MAQMNSFQSSNGTRICIDLPEAANTFSNDTVLGATGTGTAPAAAKVMADAGNFGPGAATAPTLAVANVLDSVSGGTYHAPDAAEVIDTAVFGAASGTPGTVKQAAVAKVELNYQYGPGGTGLTGELVAGETDADNILQIAGGTSANMTVADTKFLALEAGRNSGAAEAKIVSGQAIVQKGTTYNGSAAGETHTADQVVHSAGGNFVDETVLAGNLKTGITAGLGVNGTVVPEAHTANQVVHSAGGNFVDETVLAGNLKTGITAGLGVNGTVIPEAHTANQVLKSASGNWDDDNLGVGSEGNVKLATAYGLSQTGTLSGGGSLTAPSAPTITASATSKTNVRISWASVPELSEDMKIYRSGTLIATVSVATAEYYDDSARTPNTTYSYTAKASNSAGDSAASAAVSATTMSGTPDARTLSTTALTSAVAYTGIPTLFPAARGTFFDLRMFASVISEDSYGYYYKDCTTNDGLKMVPRQ